MKRFFLITALGMFSATSASAQQQPTQLLPVTVPAQDVQNLLGWCSQQPYGTVAPVCNYLSSKENEAQVAAQKSKKP